jgi:hypothetical protein
MIRLILGSSLLGATALRLPLNHLNQAGRLMPGSRAMDSAERVQNQTSGQVADSIDDPRDEGSAIDGISLADLEPLTSLLVRTANSLYRIVVLRGATVLVKGGTSFPEMTRGDLLSFGVNVLRFGWIGVGLRMEIHAGNRCIVTSPVRDLTIERSPLRRRAA